MKWYHHHNKIREMWTLTDANRIALYDYYIYEGEPVVYQIVKRVDEDGTWYEDWRPPQLTGGGCVGRKRLSEEEWNWIVTNRDVIAMEMVL